MPNTTPSSHFDTLCARGKIKTAPVTTYTTPTVLHMSMDTFVSKVFTVLNETFVNDMGMIDVYPGKYSEISNLIETDCQAVAEYLGLICYNRLRNVAEQFSTTIRSTYLNPRAPVNNKMEFPQFLASLVSGIGPLLNQDGPVEQLIIYATSTSKMNNYGFDKKPTPAEGHHTRFMTAYRKLGYATGTVDFNNLSGSYFTTTSCSLDTDTTAYFFGHLHSSHYSPQDVPKAMVIHQDHLKACFTQCVFTAAQVNDDSVIKFLAENKPTDVSATSTANDPPRSAHCFFKTNSYGIDPAEDSSSTKIKGSCWILGRGKTPYYACSLAEKLTDYDIKRVLREYLCAKKSLPASAPTTSALGTSTTPVLTDTHRT